MSHTISQFFQKELNVHGTSSLHVDSTENLEWSRLEFDISIKTAMVLVGFTVFHI